MFQKSSFVHLSAARRAMLGLLVLVAATIVVVALLTLTFGIHPSGPSYDLVADPGAALPF